MDATQILLGALIIGMVGFFIGAAAGTAILMWETGDIKELGQAICKESYDRDFKSYTDKVLKCQEPKEKYDGIIIDLS